MPSRVLWGKSGEASTLAVRHRGAAPSPLAYDTTLLQDGGRRGGAELHDGGSTGCASVARVNLWPERRRRGPPSWRRSR